VSSNTWEEDLGRRLSALSEDRVLDWFWTMARSDCDRRWLLRVVADRVVIGRKVTWNRRDVRREHRAKCGGEYGDSAAVKLTYADGCFSCGRGDELAPHHIIQIQHGGSNTLRNRVPLCPTCHRTVHPWMTEPKRPARTDRMHRAGDLIVRPKREEAS
jgi:5-methylcytosine-specific restriction endonuclease McrA